MKRDQDLQAMLGALGDGPEPTPPSGEARERILDAMQRAAGVEPAKRERILDAMQRAAGVEPDGDAPAPTATPAPPTPSPRPRARWRVPAAAFALTAAAAIALVAALPGSAPRAPSAATVHPLGGAVLLVQGGKLTPAPDGNGPLSLGDRVTTLGDGRATARLGGVATASLSPMTELTVTTEGCELRAGTVGFEVDPLPAGRRFLVRAPDADIEVHGTAFRVTVTPGTTTRVIVSDGVVSVTPRSQGGPPPARLVAGDRWPPPDDDGAPSAEVPRAAVPATPPSDADASAARGARPRATDPRPEPKRAESDLAEQNRLLAEAAEAKRRGDGGAERKALEDYLGRFPKAPGAHDAIVQKMRAAQRAGDTGGAQAAARAYLTDYPGGPLAQEARTLLAGR